MKCVLSLVVPCQLLCFPIRMTGFWQLSRSTLVMGEVSSRIWLWDSGSCSSVIQLLPCLVGLPLRQTPCTQDYVAKAGSTTCVVAGFFIVVCGGGRRAGTWLKQQKKIQMDEITEPWTRLSGGPLTLFCQLNYRPKSSRQSLLTVDQPNQRDSYKC